MAAEVALEFRRRPSVLAYMLRGFYPSPGMRTASGRPLIHAHWKGHRIDRTRLAELCTLTGLSAAEGIPMLYAHVISFPLQMAVLTHPRFPLPIWNVLQIRNHLLQHRPVADDDVLDLETRIVEVRVLEKGVEFDLHTGVTAEEELVWESVNTFYYRGRHGAAGAASPRARAPRLGGDVVARWRAPADSGWRFASVTGDYNGIHYWPWYARRLGFRRAFLHPQLVLGQSMARLPVPQGGRRQRLDAWLKGPVYHDADVHLLAEVSTDATDFGLVAEGEARPAILGRWRSGSVPGLLDDEPVGADQKAMSQGSFRT
jgi:acyl dehydratase